VIELSAQDATFLAMDRPNSPWNGGIVLVYDRETDHGAVTFQDVVDHFQARLHLVDVLRLKLMRTPGNLARPFWVEDENLDLEYHMRNIALPPPGDWRQFCMQVSRLIARPLDLARPPWELYMIEGLDAIERFSKGSFALVLKVHHAALDGRAFLAIMGVLHSLDPRAAPPPAPEKPVETDVAPSSLELLVRAGVKAVRMPMAASRTLSSAWPGLREVALPALWRKLRGGAESVAGTPETRFNGTIGPHRSWGACFFSLADTKPMRQAVEGATVHDIAVSVFGGALRAYLGERGELPTDPMRAGIVIDVRSASDRAALGNQLSGMFASLATDVEDPLERLASVRASTLAAKNTSAKMGARDVAGLLDLLPEAIISPAVQLVLAAGNRGGRGLFARFNTAVTGMAGPPAPLYLGGAKMTHVIGFGPLVDGLGLINIQMSYNGEFVLTFTADRNAMPDPQRYEECIYHAFEKLRQAALQAPVSAISAKAAAAAREPGAKRARKQARKAHPVKRAPSAKRSGAVKPAKPIAPLEPVKAIKPTKAPRPVKTAAPVEAPGRSSKTKSSTTSPRRGQTS
jgi:diacylglycerol O-acyltransferase